MNGGFCFYYESDGSTTNAGTNSIGVNWLTYEQWSDPFPGITTGTPLSSSENALILDPDVSSEVEYYLFETGETITAQWY